MCIMMLKLIRSTPYSLLMIQHVGRVRPAREDNVGRRWSRPTMQVGRGQDAASVQRVQGSGTRPSSRPEPLVGGLGSHHPAAKVNDDTQKDGDSGVGRLSCALHQLGVLADQRGGVILDLFVGRCRWCDKGSLRSSTHRNSLSASRFRSRQTPTPLPPTTPLPPPQLLSPSQRAQ